MVAINVNTNTYVIAIDNTSKNAKFLPDDANQSGIILYNGSTTSVFVTTGTVTAPTAVFPTSATVPVPGKVVAPGAIVTFTKNTAHEFISAIQSTSGVGSLFISVGAGE